MLNKKTYSTIEFKCMLKHADGRKRERKTPSGIKRLKKLLAEEKQPISWVLKNITEQFGGCIALSTTSNTVHLLDNINYLK